MLGAAGIRPKALRKGGHMAPPDSWKQYAGHGTGGGAAVGVPMSIMDRVAAQPDPPAAAPAPPTSLIDDQSDGGADSIFARIATPDTIASNASFDAERHNNAPAVKDAADSARIAEQSGMPPQAAGQRTFDEMKQQMIAEYKNTLQRAQQRRAQLADQEKEWSGFGGKIAEMFGGVAQFRMARRNQMMAGIQAEDQMANDLAERINGRPAQWHAAGNGAIYSDAGDIKQVPGAVERKKDLIYSRDPETGRVSVRERIIDPSDSGPSRVEPINLGTDEAINPAVLRQESFDARTDAMSEKARQDRASREKLAGDRLAEVRNKNNIWEDYLNGKATREETEAKLKAAESMRKAVSTDVKVGANVALDEIRDIEKKLGDQNLTPEAKQELQMKLERARRAAKNGPKVADVVKPKPKGYQVVTPGGAKYKIIGRID